MNFGNAMRRDVYKRQAYNPIFSLDDKFRLSEVWVSTTFLTVISSCVTLGLIVFVLLILD